MEYPQSNPNLWDIMPDYTNIDWNVIVSIVLSLIAILFTFDAISSDRERGTLRLTLSNSVSRGTVLVSKFLSALITISIPFLIATFINLFLLYTSGNVPLGPNEWGRLGVIIFIAFVYVSIYLGLGLLISSRVSNSSTSLTILLLVWVIWVVLLPSTIGALTSDLQPTMTRNELAARRQHLANNFYQQYDGLSRKVPSREIPGNRGNITVVEIPHRGCKRHREIE